MAGAAFGEPLFPFFVAGAASGQPLLSCFVAGARNLKLQVAKRGAKRLIVKLESNVMLVLHGRRGAKVEIVTLDAFKHRLCDSFLTAPNVMIFTFFG